MKYCILFEAHGKRHYLKNSALESLGVLVDERKRNDAVLFDTRYEAESACELIRNAIIGEIEE